jgi:hypothetical protein
MLDACDVDGEIELAGELTAERTGVAPAGAQRAGSGGPLRRCEAAVTAYHTTDGLSNPKTEAINGRMKRGQTHRPGFRNCALT